MKMRKNISRLLTVGIILNNTYLCSNANVLNSKTLSRYETLEGEVITLDDIEENDITEIEIFGNTVQDENNLENIQSVGDLYVDEKGEPILDDLGREQYKLEIESCNKNLFSNNIDDWEIGSINGTTGENTVAYTRIRTKDFIKIPKGSIIFWKKNNLLDKVAVRIYDKSKKCLYGGGFLGGNATKLPHYDEAYYLRFVVAFSDESVIMPQDIENFIVQFEVSSIETSYISHQSHKTTILLPCQLQKVGDVYDRLYWDSEKDKYVVEKNIKTMIFDGSDDEKWIGYGDSCHWLDPQFTKHNVISSNSAKPVWKNGVYIHPHGLIYLFHGFDESMSNAQFRKWLSENPVTIVFEPTNSELIETNITKKILLPTYSDKTHISVKTENGVSATLKVTIDRLEQVSQEAVNLAVSSPTSSNIGLARTYVNLLSESLYKDQLQEQLNQLFSSDMVLDRKNITSNIDVYVKSENSLHMTLSTNNITFEDYNGINDLMLDNAIEISINSSLPYQLNAYMIQDSEPSPPKYLTVLWMGLPTF